MFRIASCLAVVMVLLMVGPGEVGAVTVKNISSGFDDLAGTKLPSHTPDTDYIIGPGGTGGYIGEVPRARESLYGTYVPDSASPDSRFLFIYVNSDPESLWVPPGTYFFDTEVDLTNFRHVTAEITGLRYAADNKLIGVHINGTTVFSQGTGFAEEFRDFRVLGDLGLGEFQEGLNTIRFEVFNYGSGSSNPMSFRVEGVVQAEFIPEPSSLVLLLIGAVVLFAWYRRS